MKNNYNFDKDVVTIDIVKIIGIGLIALLLIIVIRQYKPEFTVYISLIAGILILACILPKISAIIDMLNSLVSTASINSSFLVLLLKITGIAFLTEFAVSICKDAGESAIATKIDMGGKVVIISMSIPILAGLLETVTQILP